jgi:hypothetical protein
VTEWQDVGMGDGDEHDDELNRSDVELEKFEKDIFRAIREEHRRPGGQLDYLHSEHSADRLRPLLNSLVQLAEASGWDLEDVVRWLCSSTTYFEDESRPIDHFEPDPDRVLEVARSAWGVEW